MAVNGLDRVKLAHEGGDPAIAMNEARAFVAELSSLGTPVLVAYPYLVRDVTNCPTH